MLETVIMFLLPFIAGFITKAAYDRFRKPDGLLLTIYDEEDKTTYMQARFKETPENGKKVLLEVMSMDDI